ncbi:MAG: site-specific integrase [Deltaproteobacteria bacterium]|nr:site-specific integrase [Deltaproteobacteria bacterium]
MSLRKVGNYYWLDIRIKGKRIRRSLRTDNRFLALDRYKEKKDELLSEHREGKIRFSDFCKQYLEWAWSSKPASTKREEQRIEKIKEFFESLGILFLDDVTPYHIEQLKAYLKNEIERSGDRKGMSKTTVNYYLQILRGLFNKAIAWEIYSKSNPLKKVRFYKINPKVKPLSKTDVEKALKAAKVIAKDPGSPLQKIFPDLIELAINTGARKSEILKLKWRDVLGDEIVVKEKGEKTRIVPLNSRAQEIIDRQPKKDKFVFEVPNRHQQDLMRRTTKQISKAIGRRFHFHLLRHYFASALVERGIDFITVAEILGHSKTMVSLGYAHTSKERKKRAVDLLD